MIKYQFAKSLFDSLYCIIIIVTFSLSFFKQYQYFYFNQAYSKFINFYFNHVVQSLSILCNCVAAADRYIFISERMILQNNCFQAWHGDLNNNWCCSIFE